MKSKRDDIYSAPLFKANDIAAARAIASGVWAKVPLGTVLIDNRGTFNPVLGTYSIPESGIYKVEGKVFIQIWSNPSVYAITPAIYKNGTKISVGDTKSGFPSGGGQIYNFACLITDLLALSKNDILELYVNVSNASTINLGTTDPSSGNFMSAHKVG